MSDQSEPHGEFDDILAANERYASTFDLGDLTAPADKGLAVVTCIDSRIEPLEMLGLVAGDAKIMRNAGGVVNDIVVRDLIIANHLLNVHRIMVVPHTHCAMSSSPRAEVEATFVADGVDPAVLDLGLIDDQRARLEADVATIRAVPHFRPGVVVGGFVYDVKTGRLEQVI